ncbi:hypothetical protein ACFLT9_14490 [Acidobacteriota bacterium]
MINRKNASIRQKIGWSFLTVLLAVIVSAPENCALLNSESFPDIDGWWELILSIQTSDCPAQLLGFSVPMEKTARIEVSMDKTKEILRANLYENDQYVVTLRGSMDPNGNFEIEATVTQGSDELTTKFEGRFTDNTVSGQIHQTWNVISQGIQCTVQGTLTGNKQ